LLFVRKHLYSQKVAVQESNDPDLSESCRIFRFKIKQWNPLFVLKVEALNYSVGVQSGKKTLLAETNPGQVTGHTNWALAIIQCGVGVSIDNFAIHLLEFVKRHAGMINNDE